MFDTIKIGARDVRLNSVAYCDIVYRQIFHEDPTRLQYAKDFDEPMLINFLERMAFVMAMCADKSLAELRKLNEDAFLEWLMQFGRTELLNSLGEVRRVYEEQMTTESESKKKEDQPTEE